MRVNLSPRC